MKLHYNTTPPRDVENLAGEFTDEELIWQFYSLPLGCGQMGASVYGYTDCDRIQITENSFANPYMRPPSIVNNRQRAGVTSFGNIYLHINHSDVTDYTRVLDLSDAICSVSYQCGGVSYNREYFTSNPDKLLAIRLTADKPESISLSISCDIPFVDSYCQTEGDGLSRSGYVRAQNNSIILESRLDYYGVTGYGRLVVRAEGGSVTSDSERVYVNSSDAVTLLYTMATNYRMESRVFEEQIGSEKLSPYPHPKAEVDERISQLSLIPYDRLKERHLSDFHAIDGGVSVSLGSASDSEIPTDELIRRERAGIHSDYLASLAFAFGRYLLISSSRRGGLPANLQGVWSNYRTSPWSCGYWHNINVQMNYWASYTTGLSECFLAYSDYNTAYMPMARAHADEYIKRNYPSSLGNPGENGWIIGTGGWPYAIEGANSGHSGPGTGAFTSLLFWDYYDYTRDKSYLREKAYPVLYEMSLFFSKTLEKIDGKYLVLHSASPEQMNKDGSYHRTVGCAFDQQMVYENYRRTLDAADILGIENDPLIETIREQIEYLDPVLIGKSGQIKEFREEEYYGEIGEPQHRHISHLVALYPGCSINEKHPEYMKAAEYTLNRRGTGSSGWSIIHRVLCLARLGKAEKCYLGLVKFLKNYMRENLWSQHPPYQIDGNLGFTAAVAEMLLESHKGYIELLPALPEKWSDGSFRGLSARGGFTVDCSFSNGVPTLAKIVSTMGEPLRIKSCAKAYILRDGERISVTDNAVTTHAGEVLDIFFE